MTLTTILFIMLVIAILGIIVGLLKKNKMVLWGALAVCVLVVLVILFLIFVLIPAM